MAKSKHPDLLDKAANHYAEVEKETTSYKHAAEAWTAAADKIQTRVKMVTKEVELHKSTMGPVLEQYAKVVTDIIGLEEQQEKAKKAGDKKKEKDLDKEITKTDAAATKIRDEYREIDKSRLAAMRGLVSEMEAFRGTALPVAP
jgi:methionyl-tRNA synthetase